MSKIQRVLKVTFLFIIFIYNIDSNAQSRNGKTYKPNTSIQTQKTTYNINSTKYISGETYKTTGQPKVERSSSSKHEFLKSKGYSNVPTGYQVDHKIPLSQGGKDVPSNMQLLSKEEHKQKTARERQQIGTTNKKSTYNYSTTNKTTYSTPSKNYLTTKTGTYKTNYKSNRTTKIRSYKSSSHSSASRSRRK